jgi:general secretion pathway protein E
LIPYQFAKKQHLLVTSDNDQLTLFHSDNCDADALQEIFRFLPSDTSLNLEHIEEAELERLISQTYQQNLDQSSAAMDMIQSDPGLSDIIDALPEPDDLLEDADEAPIIRLINAMISQAIKENASDIHIEPDGKNVNIRFRIDGVLRKVIEPEISLAPFLVSRIKIMAKLDIAEKRLPQDGRITLRIGTHSVDIRVSTLPGNQGERIVLRILDKQNTRLSLDQLGLSQDQTDSIKSLVAMPHGIILVTGPTGSGKTTSLYAMLNQLDKHEKNIITIEDPVEYQLEGISQTQVDRKAELTFARGLRAILRQDPDVVMVGEIRDQETAKISVQASLTGHLVLSTLHTNTAVSSITRLRDMGIESFLLSSSLIGVIAQRLVRRLCPHCKQPSDVNSLDIIDYLPAEYGSKNITLYKPHGCEECSHIGYKGRIGIYEIVPLNKHMRQLIHDNASENELEEQARKISDSIVDSAGKLLLAGDISLKEALRVIKEH